MEQPILSDASQFPTEDIIFSHIGETKPLWISLFAYIHANHHDFTEEWRYYRDGKSWLLKVTQKKKTIFWLSIIKGAFRTTFYFTDKAEEAFMSSTLSDELKQEFKSGKHFGKLRSMTIVHTVKRNVEEAKTLIDIKLRVK